ncbi:hypothetical protein ALC62_15460 [Cyphomyrmex costatus]|uniref:Uncharacterized protein n=1 Tax=Cyphomyrmex costatus TaxID=456900 RepID=A0A151I6X5_9HYME|nr:hypothetical protein ALC62_15460 [Cyphomyrmex costatus]
MTARVRFVLKPVNACHSYDLIAKPIKYLSQTELESYNTNRKKISIRTPNIYLPKAFTKATISLLSKKNDFRLRLLSVDSHLSNFPENNIFNAVPSPWICNLPHSLHLSHPTQSIIREIFIKCCLNSSFNTCASAPPDPIDFQVILVNYLAEPTNILNTNVCLYESQNNFRLLADGKAKSPGTVDRTFFRQFQDSFQEKSLMRLACRNINQTVIKVTAQIGSNSVLLSRHISAPTCCVKRKHLMIRSDIKQYCTYYKITCV